MARATLDGGSDGVDPSDHLVLVREFSTTVVAKLAPEELAVFDETVDDYLDDPEAVLNPRRREEAVGFGIEAALLTPLVLAAVTPVVTALAEAVAETMGVGVREAMKRLALRVLGKEPRTDPDEVPPLTRAQAERVRSVAVARGRALGLAEDQAVLLADAVVGGAGVGP